MNRTEFMRAVYDTDLDPVSKSILVYLGYRKNWQDGSMAFPSAAKVAADTGYSTATVKRKMPELRAKGYLSDTGRRVGRGVIVYDLADPTSITVIPQEYHSDTAQYQSDTAGVSERYTEQVREQVQEQEKEQVHVSPTADAAVDSETSSNSEVKKEQEPEMRRFLNKGEYEVFLRVGRTHNATTEEQDEAERLLTSIRLPGDSWMEQVENAYMKAGTAVVQW